MSPSVTWEFHSGTEKIQYNFEHPTLERQVVFHRRTLLCHKEGISRYVTLNV